MADSDDTAAGTGRTRTDEASGEPDPDEEADAAGEGAESATSGEAPDAAPQNRRARRAARAAERAGGGGAAATPATGARPGGRPIPARPGSPAGGLDAGERMDDAFVRASDGAFRWVKRHFNIVQWLIVVSLALWIGFQIYTWRSDKAARALASSLDSAVSAQDGLVGPADQAGIRDDRGSLDPRKRFATDEARLTAAREGYQGVITEHAGTRAGDMARLGLAGVVFDEGKHEEARKLYDEVLSSELAKVDPEAKGRALEGMALAIEAKGDKDAALKRYQELENADIPGFKELALYHQGRLLHAKGDKAGASEKLKKVVEKLSKELGTAPGSAPTYLALAAKELLERVDPAAVPKPSADETLQKALAEFQKNLPQGVTTAPMPMPAAPPVAPSP